VQKRTAQLRIDLKPALLSVSNQLDCHLAFATDINALNTATNIKAQQV
jgi:hypothetical protein